MGALLLRASLPPFDNRVQFVESMCRLATCRVCAQMCDDTIVATHTPASLKSGSTAVVVLMRRGVSGEPTRLYCANVGDSKAVLCRNGKAVEMSYDHKPSREDERQRIIEAGGTVITNRLYGVLGVSRSFGDLRFKNAMVRRDCVRVCARRAGGSVNLCTGVMSSVGVG